VRFGGSVSTPFPLVSELGFVVDAIVFLLLGTASVSSESDSLRELPVSELAACEC